MKNFIDKPINIKDLPKDIPANMCLIENNEKQIGQICDFLVGDKSLLQVCGFKGSGKSQIVNFITVFLNPDFGSLYLFGNYNS